MSDKIKQAQVEAILKLTLLQRQIIFERIQAIEDDTTLDPEDKLQLLSEIINPASESK